MNSGRNSPGEDRRISKRSKRDSPVQDRRISKRDKRDNPGEDRISNLPNFIIGLILSFLSLEEAVRTSILSRRWVYMWTYITTLCLKDKLTIQADYSINKTSFINFLCNLLHRLNASNINGFYLSLSEKYDPYILNQVISLVSSKKVKVIGLRSIEECNISCHPIFKCQSLENLVIAMGLSVIQFPSFVCLSSLTSLTLTFIRDPMKITCYSSNHSKELTLKFPVLREYTSLDCIWLAVNRVTIEAPLLKEVKIYRQWCMSSDVSKAAIEIHSSCITKYRCISYISSETILLDAAHVADASICLTESKVKKTRKQKQIFVSKLFNIKNLKCLRLENLNPIEHYFADIPVFGMLGYLQLCYTEAVENLLCLLLKTPCLETLVLEAPIYSDAEVLDFATVPECFQSTLKVVRFVEFAGSEPELSFAKFVMEKSQFLESISFSCYKMHKSKIGKIKEKIFLFKRSFNIEFSVHLG